MHLTGANQHRIARGHADPGPGRRGGEIVAGDRVVVVEVVDAVEPRDVEQHAARRECAEVLDAELRGAGRR